MNYILAALVTACVALGSGWWVERAGRARDAAQHAHALAERDNAIDRSNAAILLAEAERNAAGAEIARVAALAAAAQQDKTRTDTHASVERIRTVVRTVTVPAGCPVVLPDSVQAELAAGVEQARSANGRLRAAGDR